VTFSYTKDPTNKINDKIRFLIGDTVDEKHLVENEEILFALAEQSNDVEYTCAMLCDAIAVKFAREADVRVSNYTTSRTSICEKYQKLATKFRQSKTKAAHFVVPSISVSDKMSNEDDSTLVQPLFKRNMMDNIDSSNEMDLA
jgi:hypothetical protein